jgi:hypothetical protein
VINDSLVIATLHTKKNPALLEQKILIVSGAGVRKLLARLLFSLLKLPLA